jgi:hypothetical protein
VRRAIAVALLFVAPVAMIAGCSSTSSKSPASLPGPSTTALGSPTTSEPSGVPTTSAPSDSTSPTTVFKQPTPTTTHVEPTTPNS